MCSSIETKPVWGRMLHASELTVLLSICFRKLQDVLLSQVLASFPSQAKCFFSRVNWIWTIQWVPLFSMLLSEWLSWDGNVCRRQRLLAYNLAAPVTFISEGSLLQKHVLSHTSFPASFLRICRIGSFPVVSPNRIFFCRFFE